MIRGAAKSTPPYPILSYCTLLYPILLYLRLGGDRDLERSLERSLDRDRERLALRCLLRLAGLTEVTQSG